ncbi:MAG: hypothetical protein HBSAPP03_23690 [Phycisphaerae bacterium]|nr:MAG: hypothetical protein HBSAPP03_23690 [Phycisphaerae bacterium]
MPSDNKTMADWGEELDRLLREAHAARQGGGAAVQRAQDALADFIDRSPDYADALDQVADLAIMDLDIAVTKDAVEALRTRREELARIMKTLGGTVGELKKSAAVLRLESARAAVDSITETVKALKDVRAKLRTTGDEKTLGEAILKAIAEIQGVRSKIETALG